MTSGRTTPSHFNPRSSCEERRLTQGYRSVQQISIHAPHARSDRTASSSSWRIAYFNPRSSCEERHNEVLAAPPLEVFQSTLLMRGATSGAVRRVWMAKFQSTLLMRGATELKAYLEEYRDISIHAPHARSDGPVFLFRINTKFQSTLLMRGATLQQGRLSTRTLCISIHAPHARSDECAQGSYPRGSRAFQSTLLMRGATVLKSLSGFCCRISIHAPHARSDICTPMRQIRLFKNFNPRSSCEERPSLSSDSTRPPNFNPRSSCEERREHGRYRCGVAHGISIHAPHARSDFRTVIRIEYEGISIHAPHARSDFIVGGAYPAELFQSTLLMRGATRAGIPPD